MVVGDGVLKTSEGVTRTLNNPNTLPRRLTIAPTFSTPTNAAGSQKVIGFGTIQSLPVLVFGSHGEEPQLPLFLSTAGKPLFMPFGEGLLQATVLVPSSGHISIEGIERWPEEELGRGLTALSLGENSKAAIGSVERAGALVHRPVRACGTIFLSPLPHPR